MLRELAESVRSRRVSARHLVERSLDRIERLDGALGAVVATRPEEALAEAAALDERLARGEAAGPLAGIPFLVKDIEDLAGIPTTHGSLLFADALPAVGDGLVVRRLRAAGAIPVGKANTPEFATQGFTANRLFGPTRNPWAPAWSPGGSSGGSGAAIAAGMVPVATATDTGGSIRIPAAFCGLAGIKPTNGLVPFDPALCWPDLTTSGPLAVSVADLRLLLGVHTGTVPGPSPGARSEPAPGRLPGRVVALARFLDWGPLPRAVEDAFQAALAVLERDLGLQVEPREPAEVVRAGNPAADWVALTAPELVAWLGPDTARQRGEALAPTTRTFVEIGLGATLDGYLAARARRPRYALDLDRFLRDDAVVASPALAADGWLAEGPLPGSADPAPPPSVYNTDLQNLTGHPAVVVPAGRMPNGIPFGLQLTGARFGDGMLLDLAAAWEAARPWPLAADGYEPFGP